MRRDTNLISSTCLVAVLGSLLACNGDSPSGTEPLPLDMRGTWLAIVQVRHSPESACFWAGTLEIPTQNGGSFTGVVEVDLEDDIPGFPDLEPSPECSQESTLQEPVTGSITVDGDITFVLGSLDRMRDLIETVTTCSVILPVEELSGFVAATQEGNVVGRDFLAFSFNTVQCSPEDEDIGRTVLLSVGAFRPVSP